MANPYAASIQLTANVDKVSTSLALVTSMLGGTLGQVNRIEKGFREWNPAIMAASGAIAGMGLLRVVEGVERAGEKLIHAKTILSAMVPEYQRLATVQQATDAAWRESDRNRRSVLSESIKIWKDTFTVTQSQEAASHLLHPITILKNALDSLKDTIGATFDDTQIISAIRAFDIAGRTTDERIEKAVKDYTRTAIGLGSRSDPGKLLTAVTGMGPMAQGLSDKSLTETVPILQALELGSRTPSAMYQIYRLWQGGGGALSSRQANEAQIKWGLHKEEDRQERASGNRRISFGKHLSVGGGDQTFSGFKPGTIFEEELLYGPKQDLAQWGKDVREKLLAPRGVDINDTVQVQKAIAEMTRANKLQSMGLGALWGPIGQRQLQREQAQIERIPLDVGDYINAHDPKAIRAALEDQWKTVNEVIGEQIAPTYMSTIFKPLTEIFHSIAVLAKENPEAVKNWALAISAIGGSMVGLGSMSLIARFLPGGTFIMALTAFTAALVALGIIDPKAAGTLLRGLSKDIEFFVDIVKGVWHDFSAWLGKLQEKGTISHTIFPFRQGSFHLGAGGAYEASGDTINRAMRRRRLLGLDPGTSQRSILPNIFGGLYGPDDEHPIRGSFSDIGAGGKPDAQKFIREQAYANAKAFGDYFGLMPGGGLGALGSGGGSGGWGGHYSGGSGAGHGQRSILDGGTPDIPVHPHYSGGTGRARGQRSINHGGIPNANVPMLRGTGKNESAEVVNAITEIATNLGNDPRVAIGVARSEGLPGFDPATGHWSSGSNDHGTSWGPFQAHIHSNIPGMRARGQGDVMLEQGLDPRKMENWKKVIEWQLRYAKHHGWREWHGWRGAERAGLDAGVEHPHIDVPPVGVPHLTDHMTRPEIDAWNAHIPHAAREHTASVFARMRLPHSVRGGGLESGSYGGESYTHAAPGGPQSTTGYGHAPIGAPPRNQHQSRSHVYLDGRVIGEVIEHRITKRHTHTHGPGGHDGRRGLTPVDSWSVA